jgi:2-polyprenyl-6-methoxyphenol hydroxylase-like FAD-dependent oxidoreductase
MLLKNKKVAIIGAGPVGLTMAKLLQQNGINVSVYERDENALTRVSGGPLDLHKGSGQEAMKKAGLLEAYCNQALAMGRTVANEQGKILFSKKPTPENQYDNPEINRNDLRKLLLDNLESDTVIWNSKFSGLEEQNGKWLLQFENEITATADFIIVANGGMSQARKYVTDAQIEYTGTVMIQGDVFESEIKCPALLKMCDDTILMTANKGTLLVANPKNGNALSYGVTFKKPEKFDLPDTKNKESIIQFLSDRCSHWHESYKQLFRSTSSFVVLQTRKIPLDQPWKNNRPLPITLIGDAAHIMPPFAGQGVNTGLMDALILSENLTNGKHETIEAAINDYEQKMFVYAKEAQLETSKNEKEIQDPSFSFQKIYQ